MIYDYKRYFGKIAVIRDLTTMPEKAGRTTAPAENDEQHPIVPERLRMPKMRSRPNPELVQWRLDNPEVRSADT
jgi:hypothetical protein